jgi:hypothetical protein
MKKTIAMLMMFAASAVSALAFPSWMGVYGSVVRHDDANNPGTFTILMNQDYYGLKAEVGVQVNGGTWQVFPMSYAGKVESNSKWTFTPSAAFPAGANVAYYFHGFDGSGHIWDSNGGKNYGFTAPGSSDGLTFSGAQSLGLPAAGATLTDSFATTSRVYAMCGAFLNRGSIVQTGIVWSGWTNVTVPARRIAATPAAVLAVDAEAGTLKVARSTDGGATFGSSQVINVSTQHISSFEAGARGASEFVVAYSLTGTNGYPYDAKELYCVKSSDNGQTWSAPVRVDSADYGWYDSIEIGANASHFVIKYRYTAQAYDARIGAATSTDGLVWQAQTLFTDKAASFSTMVVAPDAAYVALDPYYNDATRFAKFVNGTWELSTIPHPNYESGRGTILALDPQGALLLLRIEAYPSTRWQIAKSTDRGATWYAIGSLDTPPAVPSNPPFLAQALTAGKRLHLVWMNGDWRYGSILWQVSLPRAGGPVKWIGKTWAFPFEGEWDAGEDLWINTETSPRENATKVRVVYTADGGVTWKSSDLELETSSGSNDTWHVNLGVFPAGTTVRFALEATGGDGKTIWDNNGGKDFTATCKAVASPVQRIADGLWRTFAGADGITWHEDCHFWIDFQVRKLGTVQAAGIVWTYNDWATWYNANASFERSISADQDQWGVDVSPCGQTYSHRSLGFIRWYPAGSTDYVNVTNGQVTIKYAIFYLVNNKWYWDNNGGKDYSFVIR